MELSETEASAAAAHLRAYMEYAVGDFAEADHAIRQAIALTPDNPALHFDDGLVQAARCDWQAAAAAFRQARDGGYHTVDAAYNLGVAEGKGRAAAILRDPRLLISALFKPNTAVERCGWKILARYLPEVQDAISFAHLQRGDMRRAEDVARAVMKAAPAGVRYLALGTILQRAGHYKKAQAALMKAKTLGADAQAVDRHFAEITLALRNYEESRQICERLRASDPDNLFVLSRLLLIDTVEGKMDAAEARFNEIKTIGSQRGFASLPWEALSSIAYRAIMWPLPQAARRNLDLALDQQVRDATGRRGGAYSPAASATGTRRMRIGYLSGCFRNHPIGHVTTALFGAHDRAKVEIHVFYAGARATDSYHRSIATSAQHFHHLPGKISETAQAIFESNLDILVYLDGYMDRRLMQVVALRPAPVQIHWLGHAGECATSAIDYVIADEVVVPKGEDALYRTKVVRLPNSYHCASPHAIGRVPSRRKSGLPREGFVFCGFNNPEKIDRKVFDAWMRILKATENSVLWLSAGPSDAFEHNLRADAESSGVAPERLIFARRLPDKADHLARLKHGGLLLDTLTLNASTTALDALWAGVPVLTVHGDRFASRIATSMLKAVGLDEMICTSLADYERRAIELAYSPEALTAIRERLARNVPTHPLFDIGLFCRNMEALYRSLL